MNGTLKTMLRKMTSESPNDWDKYLEPILFAYREAPRSSTGFSPFELLYGRTERGTLRILRDFWSKSDLEFDQMNLYEYVVVLGNRIEGPFKIAKESTIKAQNRYGKYNNKKSKLRTLEVGQKVNNTSSNP